MHRSRDHLKIHNGRPGTSPYLQKMLTFFRRIRRSLLESGRFRRYLLYAIGEIALVVIGILIALQINNWYQERIDRAEEHRIHEAISEKMLLNRFQLKTAKTRHNEVIESAKNLLRQYQNKDMIISSEQNAIDLNSLSNRFLVGNSNKTNIYDELIASGQMNLLTSDILRNALTSLKVQMELLASYEDLQNRFVDEELIPFLNKYSDRWWIYSNLANHDSSHVDGLYQLGLDELGSRTNTPYYDPALLESRVFSNLLFELIRQTSRLLPIYDRIEQQLNTVDSIVNEA